MHYSGGQANKWGDRISAEREAKLEELLNRYISNPEGHASPFAGELLTGADVFFIAMHYMISASGKVTRESAERSLRDERYDEGELVIPDVPPLPLQKAWLTDAQLQGAILPRALLQGARLHRANLSNAVLVGAHLENASLTSAVMDGALMTRAHLEGAKLGELDIRHSTGDEWHYEPPAQLRGADLQGAHLEGADLSGVNLAGANLCKAFLSATTTLDDATLGMPEQGYARVADIRWGDANVSAMRWPKGMRLGDEAHALVRARRIMRSSSFYLLGEYDVEAEEEEYERYLESIAADRDNVDSSVKPLENAGNVNSYEVSSPQTPRTKQGTTWAKGKRSRFVHRQKRRIRRWRHNWTVRKKTRGKKRYLQSEVFEAAIRANRQTSNILRSQGLIAQADDFSYRAYVLQRQLYFRLGMILPWAGYELWALVTGYGYKLWRILLAYVGVIILFACIYWWFGLPQDPQPYPHDYVLVSLTAIHGRTFFEQFDIHSPLAWVAAFESIVGIVLEAGFAAMLVQKFFGSR